MTDFPNSLSASLQDWKSANWKILLDNDRKIETTDIDSLNKFAIDKLNEYLDTNA